MHGEENDRGAGGAIQFWVLDAKKFGHISNLICRTSNHTFEAATAAKNSDILFQLGPDVINKFEHSLNYATLQ